jgi:hypothetical protein
MSDGASGTRTRDNLRAGTGVPKEAQILGNLIRGWTEGVTSVPHHLWRFQVRRRRAFLAKEEEAEEAG